MNRRHFLQTAAGLLGASLMGGQIVHASEENGTLTIAFTSEVSSLDPHWHLVSANSSVAHHIFDRLTHADAEQIPRPGLATSWRVIDDLTWEYTLRKNVFFHNGEPLTADDVIFSLDRAQNVPGAPFSMRAYLGDKTVEKIDDYTLRIRTRKPNPIVPNELSTASIISRKVGLSAVSADYNSGKAAIGTGPYRLVEWTPGNRLVLERNEQYWGEKPQWRRVVIRPIAVGGSRVAALLAGDVDLIDNVPPTDLKNLSSSSHINLARGVTNRAIFLSFDQHREHSPFVQAKDGSAIRNAFLDVRVRQAVALAIDKQAIADRILLGSGEPATQLVPPGIFGHSPNLKLQKPDPEKARALLSEAGMRDGFRVTLHGPNDRFIRDSEVVQAVAQMLSRIGIDVTVETMPSSVFYKRATSGGPEGGSEFSFFLIGYGGGTGEASPALKSVLHTRDTKAGLGATNRTRYSNPRFDELLDRALTTLDDTQRAALFAQATDVAIEDAAIVPLYHPINIWASRKPIQYKARTDEKTLAASVHT